MNCPVCSSSGSSINSFSKTHCAACCAASSFRPISSYAAFASGTGSPAFLQSSSASWILFWGSAAPESSHAIRAAIDEALKCRETGEEKTIVFGLTGTGYFEMVAYENFHDGQMSDYIPTDADLQKGFDGIPRFPGNEI